MQFVDDHEFGVGETLHVILLRKQDRKSTRLNSSYRTISYAVFCLKKKKRYSRSRALSPWARPRRVGGRWSSLWSSKGGVAPGSFQMRSFLPMAQTGRDVELPFLTV